MTRQTRQEIINSIIRTFDFETIREYMFDNRIKWYNDYPSIEMMMETCTNLLNCVFDVIEVEDRDCRSEACNFEVRYENKDLKLRYIMDETYYCSPLQKLIRK